MKTRDYSTKIGIKNEVRFPPKIGRFTSHVVVVAVAVVVGVVVVVAADAVAVVPVAFVQ